MLLPYKDKFPETGSNVFIAETAVIIGDVLLQDESNVWFNTVIRGDVHYIRIGKRTNVQDNCTLHVTHNKYPLIIGDDVTIGHNAVVHACTLRDNILVGMGAIILDNAFVNSNVIVAAGSVVLENFQIPEGVLVAGVPAKIVREISTEEIQKIKQSALNYVKYSKTYMG